MPEIGHSSSSRGANARSRGRRPRCRHSLTWPYARMPFVVTRRRGRRSLPKRLMLMKTARFPAGWDACGVGRESLIQGRCMPNGRFSHLYHGGDIRPLRAEYSEPSKGRGEEVASHLSAPRAAISARGSRGQRLPQVSPRACGTTPTSPFF